MSRYQIPATSLYDLVNKANTPMARMPIVYCDYHSIELLKVVAAELAIQEYYHSLRSSSKTMQIQSHDWDVTILHIRISWMMQSR